MKTENEFIPYEHALALKELGFDKPCFWYYVLETNGDYKLYDKSEVKTYFTYIEAPLYQQAFGWFREKYGLIGQPMPLCISYPGKVTHYGWSIVSNQNSIDWENEDDGFKIYKKAESACLDKLIEIVKKKK